VVLINFQLLVQLVNHVRMVLIQNLVHVSAQLVHLVSNLMDQTIVMLVKQVNIHQMVFDALLVQPALSHHQELQSACVAHAVMNQHLEQLVLHVVLVLILPMVLSARIVLSELLHLAQVHARVLLVVPERLLL
jgi:hypothetical protein